MELIPKLMPRLGNRTRFPSSPDNGKKTPRNASKPPSIRIRPAPTVSGSSVTSGRCCACATDAVASHTPITHAAHRTIRIS
jgi:hypothetical protein